MIKNSTFIVITLLMGLSNINAKVYKCIDDNGTIHYQPYECNGNDNEKIMDKVKLDNESQFQTERTNSNNILINDNQHHYNEQLNGMTQQDKNKCLSYLKKYDQIKELIKARCVRNREDNCDLPAEQIENKRYQNELSILKNKQINHDHLKTYQPPIVQMKNKLTNMNCL